MEIQAASGFVLLIAAGIALFLANSPWSEQFNALWHTHLRVSLGDWAIDQSMLHWLNDGLMTIFFFVVGLEIKREIVEGELREPRKAALPLMAAIGGMIAPAVIYLLMIGGEESGKTGWGIPMATDIAFVVGFLALLGNRVPLGLKILLLALAIVDDIGAILVIAVFYSTGVSGAAISLAVLGFALTLLARWLGIRNVGIYVLISIGIWLAIFHSGIHPTVAGVLLGLLTPSKPILPRIAFRNALAAVLGRMGEDDEGTTHGRLSPARQIKGVAIESVSPLERLETALHPWVAFVIMPLFALGNAGVKIDLGVVTHPIAWSVAVGLVVGKPLGIVLFSWVAVQIGLAKLPTGVNWRAIAGAGFLAGIGFTMSLFIASLALDGDLLSAGKIGTLLGSAISASIGLGLLRLVLPTGDRAQTDLAPAEK